MNIFLVVFRHAKSYRFCLLRQACVLVIRVFRMRCPPHAMHQPHQAPTQGCRCCQSSTAALAASRAFSCEVGNGQHLKHAMKDKMNECVCFHQDELLLKMITPTWFHIDEFAQAMLCLLCKQVTVAINPSRCHYHHALLVRPCMLCGKLLSAHSSEDSMGSPGAQWFVNGMLVVQAKLMS